MFSFWINWDICLCLHWILIPIYVSNCTFKHKNSNKLKWFGISIKINWIDPHKWNVYCSCYVVLECATKIMLRTPVIVLQVPYMLSYVCVICFSLCTLAKRQLYYLLWLPFNLSVLTLPFYKPPFIVIMYFFGKKKNLNEFASILSLFVVTL